MAIPTHVLDDITDAGRYRSFIGPHSTLFNFSSPMKQMDGREFFARLIFKLPRPGWSEDFKPDELEVESYLQAGGSSEQMTVEIRKATSDGVYRLFTVGRPPASDTSTAPSVKVDVGENPQYVYANELWTADEAAKLFFHYHTHDDVPEQYVLRDGGYE